MPVDLPGFAYAAIVAVGGIVGYTKAGSIPSLGAGLVFGGILGYGAWQSSQDRSNYGVLLGTSTLLLILMGSRFYSSGKYMPAGLITTISAGAVLRYGYRAVSVTADKVSSTVP